MTDRRSGRVRGPLSPYAAGFRAELESRGYAPVSVADRLRQFSQLSRWLDAERLAPAEFTGEQAERFLAARRGAGLVKWVSPTCLAVPLGYLRDAGVTPAGAAVPAGEPAEDLLEAYRDYLAGERGLAATTVARYARIARSFCLAVPARPGGLGGIRAADVTAFLVAMSGQASPPSLSMTVTALASLLRYLHVAGVTAAPLASGLPAVPGWRAARPPAGLEPAEVTRLMASCDQRRAAGRRDYAILLLLARLGLRAGEVAALRLDDADWYHGEIVVRGKADRHERLPLPADVGAAVAAYLRRGRPQAPAGDRALFLRVRVVEVDRSDRQDRRRQGKSDPLDAVSAARAAQSGRARGAPKGRDGTVEAIRALMVAKRSARSERTQTINQARALVLTGPDDLRARFAGHTPAALVAEMASLRPRPGDVVGYAVRVALRELGRRAEFPGGQLQFLDELIVPLVTAHAPRAARPLRDRPQHRGAAAHRGGRPPERLRSEAAWAHLCAAAPIPASSGRTVRHRLNPGGDRQANHALWRIAFTRMGSDPATRAYVVRRTAEGKSKAEIIRCLKRYVAREAYPHLRPAG